MRALVVLIGLLWPLCATASDYVLRAGDMLRIEVLEDSSLNRNALVLPDGSIAFPLVGQLQAAGMSLAKLRGALAGALAPNFVAPPNVHVAVSSLAQRPKRAAARVAARPARTAAPAAKALEVFGMGELGKPGKQRVSEGATLMQFVAQAGGVTPYAAVKRVQIRRTDTKTGAAQVFRINLKKLMSGTAKTAFGLQDGDVVIVPERRLFE